MRSLCTSRSRFALIDALNAEWDELERDRQLAAGARSVVIRWAADNPACAGCGTPAEVLAAVRDEPDRVLAALIGVHQASRIPGAPPGDHLAGRIVLQTMLGKIVAMAVRDSQHGVEDYVGQLWARIDSYPLARRPCRIAANLALDTLKAVTRDASTPGWAATVPVTTAELELAGLRHIGLDRTVFGTAGPPAGPQAGSAEQVADLSARRVLRTAQELGLIDEPTRRLLLSVYADGLTSADAAVRHGLSPSTVRFRCSKAIRRMAQHAMSIAEAA